MVSLHVLADVAPVGLLRGTGPLATKAIGQAPAGEPDSWPISRGGRLQCTGVRLVKKEGYL